MTKTINVIDEFSKQFQKEQMLAFFEFSHQLDSGKELSGICKISQPLSDKSSKNYLGLFFIFDIEDSALWAEANKLMQQINDADLKDRLISLDYPISAPIINPGPEVFVKQLDLVFTDEFNITHEFIQKKLVPAVCATADLNCKDLVWWEDICGEDDEEIQKEGLSLFGQFKQLISTPFSNF